MSKNTTAVYRGVLLAKEALAIRTSTPIKISDMEKGNRAQRRMAEKQKRRKK